MTRRHVALAILLASSISIHAQVPSADARNQGAIDYGISPEFLADAIVIHVSDQDLSLHRPERTERVIRGKTLKVEKGPLPKVIVHAGNAIVRPLQAGVPMRVFLKRFPDRDAYYVIAVLPLSSGVQP